MLERPISTSHDLRTDTVAAPRGRGPRALAAALAAAFGASLILAACSGGEEDFPDRRRQPTAPGSVFGGSGGITLFGSGDSESQPDDSGGGIGVNSFLWRASLDTVAFMPIASADPFGGVIITDWYTPPATPDDRFKLNVFILDRQLRADGIRVAVFRQVRDGTGEWIDAAVEPGTVTAMEDAILARAREIRVASSADE
ncbi:MAG: DUF3576 domain-containing protein [Rhodospirillaceae bacterium]|nr:DUF3576 domain-containing protein [Rhodospirillaceae bacterium]